MFDLERYEKIKTQFYHICKRLKIDDLCEDIVQEFFTCQLEGHNINQRLFHFTVDYLRKYYARKTNKTYQVKNLWYKPLELHEKLISRECRFEKNLIDRIYLKELSDKITHRTLKLILEGNTNQEVGILLGVSEQRALQLRHALVKQINELEAKTFRKALGLS